MEFLWSIPAKRCYFHHPHLKSLPSSCSNALKQGKWILSFSVSFEGLRINCWMDSLLVWVLIRLPDSFLNVASPIVVGLCCCTLSVYAIAVVYRCRFQKPACVHSS